MTQDDPNSGEAKGLTVTTEEEKTAVERALDLAGVDYETQRVWHVTVEEVPDSPLADEMEFTEPQVEPDGTELSDGLPSPPRVQHPDVDEPYLPDEGFHRRVAVGLANMDVKWASASDVSEHLNVETGRASQALSKLFKKNGCVERRWVGGSGQTKYEYRVRDRFRTELVDDPSADVRRAFEDPSKQANR